jgi:hypothetical protein
MTKFGDRYGYYQIGDIKTYSRYELMDEHHVSPQAWQWNYNDEFFGSYNWNNEPQQTIDELYKKRAEQLRREYDYLVLYYSGGYDSANMLYAFLDNDIKLDEICVFYSRYDNTSNQYKELSSVSWKKLNEIKKKYPSIKIRKFDYADYFFKWDKMVNDLNLNKDLLYMFGAALSVNHIVTDLAYTYVEDWQSILSQGKKLSWIYGVDKPQLRYHEDKWIFNFFDGLTQTNITPMRQMIDNGNIGTYEFFYWAPVKECVDICIKQSHMIKNNYSKKHFKTFIEGFGWVFDKMSLPFLEIIYPRIFKLNEKFYDVKNTSDIWGNRDQWYFNSQYPGSNVHWEIYQSTFKDNKKHYKNWYNNNSSIESGFRNAISQDYII